MLKLNLEFSAHTPNDIVALLESTLRQVKNGDNYISTVFENKDSVEGEIIDTEAQKKEWEETAGYKLSDNQVSFCHEADQMGHDINFGYSGRGMYGKKCPAVTVNDSSDFPTATKYKTDNLGLDIVMYAQY